ncbi:MAG TPA: response regulator, partial [Candidatus Bathyarchaeia archaeon]|nr:response regulator [Candidatus Bathyarchaeia archaeon]
MTRDVALTFSPFVALLVTTVWAQLFGRFAPLSLVSGVLFILQPLFALHLASLIRQVPRSVFVGCIVFLAISLVPTVLRVTVAPFYLLPVLGFVVVEAVAAFYLLLESRRRSGPSARRLGIAASSTGLFAAALFVIGGGALAPDLTEAVANVALALALVAAIGYLVAFMPPAAIRRLWQAGPTVQYQHRLLVIAARPVDEIWAGLARLAASLTGGTATIVARRADGRYAVLASTQDGLTLDGAASDLAADHVHSRDVRVEDLPETTVAGAVARQSGGRFVSWTGLGADGPEAPILISASSHRSLFHGSDLELLTALGAQTTIVVERRGILAQQEAMSQRLAQTVEALQAANRAKSDFLASMSHELRTPLSAILGFSDLMRHEVQADGIVQVPIEWVEHIHTGGQHLLALINDVLDLSKVEAGRMELRLERFELGAAVAELVNGVRPLAERKGIALSADVPAISLVADRGRFRQIMYNLLSNAIKYTPEGGSVRVEAQDEANETRLVVVDTGVGIAAADLDAVFEEFRQVGAEENREGGTGLGLALSRRLVEAHQGRIEVESTVGVGSRFVVTIPHLEPVQVTPTNGAAAPARSTAAPSVRPAPGSQNGHRPEILVIEDDPSALRLLREYLEPAGYSVRGASDGTAGLTSAKAQRPAAIVLDVLLPGLDGWEVLRLLKAERMTRDIPVVMVTVVDEREVGLALGAVDYLVKPVERNALISCLDRLGLRDAHPDRPPTILAVDDEPAELALIGALLSEGGYGVIAANGGREALRQVRTNQVDAIVCDLVMPELDGFGVI